MRNPVTSHTSSGMMRLSLAALLLSSAPAALLLLRRFAAPSGIAGSTAWAICSMTPMSSAYESFAGKCNGSAVEYFTCFMLMFDFTLATPAIFGNEYTQNSRYSSRSRTATRNI